MGDKKVSTHDGQEHYRAFTRAVLTDLQALEKMLSSGMLEDDVCRIGAEQEMFLVDSAMHPAPIVMEVIHEANEPRLTTEIGKFNLEANLTPLKFSGNCLSRLEAELNEVLGIVRSAAAPFGGSPLLCGILPTIQQSDLVAANLTPSPRYTELNRVLTELHGDDRLVHIKGLDEMSLHLHDTFIEFCNTSFQVHLQPPIHDFVRIYNWSQAVTAPVLAASVNSPLLLGHRLWHETRLALFQHAVDERSPMHHERNRPARVTFGRDWVRGSMIDVFHEDVARFRVILTRDSDEDSLRSLAEGRVPQLAAWRMHNGTVWRWNRACYGILNGKPSLRIEARFLPAGPTIADEVANAAVFLGLLMALPLEFGDVSDKLAFDDAKTNFFSAARNGLRSQMTWIDGRTYASRDLLLDHLVPRARQGLQSVAIASDDIGRYVDLFEERVRKEMTGSQWMLNSLARMDSAAKQNVRLRTLTAAMKNYQENGTPISKWEPAAIAESTDWIDNYRTVEQFMTRDLFTVRPDDLVDLAANVMNWRRVRHVPVEDDAGNLVGIISYRDLLKLFAESDGRPAGEIVVSEVMRTDLITVTPETPTLEALYLMRSKNIGALPVCRNGKLAGIITAHDFLTVSTRLFEERLKLQTERPLYAPKTKTKRAS
jgi:CBS domain-containing protein/gamma-glutamyl:cysteine ligase YbdK (ATP-grasp superfamily)